MSSVVTREQWGAAAPRWRVYSRGPLLALVLHHTGRPARHLAGADAEREAQLVRGIQEAHFARGFADIGYHFVILPSGRVFAGRPRSVIGSHAFQFNFGTLAIALVGNFDVEEPAEAALGALRRLRRRLERDEGPAPLVGHRDLGDTTCPGEALHPYVDPEPHRTRVDLDRRRAASRARVGAPRV